VGSGSSRIGLGQHFWALRRCLVGEDDGFEVKTDTRASTCTRKYLVQARSELMSPRLAPPILGMASRIAKDDSGVAPLGFGYVGERPGP
jgi:hypothetical protein